MVERSGEKRKTKYSLFAWHRWCSPLQLLFLEPQLIATCKNNVGCGNIMQNGERIFSCSVSTVQNANIRSEMVKWGKKNLEHIYMKTTAWCGIPGVHFTDCRVMELFLWFEIRKEKMNPIMTLCISLQGTTGWPQQIWIKPESQPDPRGFAED